MTPMAATSMPTPTRNYTAFARRHKDGSVLLSIADDRICKLNGVGALTWITIEESADGLRLDEIVELLRVQFEAINAEGELRYEVSPAQLRQDTARFLEKLAGMNLLKVMPDLSGRNVYSINEGVSGTTSTFVAAAKGKATSLEKELSPPIVRDSLKHTSAPTETTQLDEGARSVSVDEVIKPSKRETLTAFIGLAAFDLLLKLFGFQALIRRVARWPTAKPRTTDREICKRVRATVDRAQMYYPKKAMCLQHSAVVTCLLRSRGVPAELVLAAQEFPPKGHAWAEVEDEVVNDSQRVKTKYLELRRV